jgi:NAD(P)H-nitrite reductase large subunit
MDEIKSVPGLMIQRDGSYALTVECPNGIVTPKIIEAVSRITKDMGITTHLTTAQKIMLLGLNQKTGQRAIELLEEAGASIRKARDISQPRVCVGKPYCTLALQETFPLGEYIYKELARTPIPPKLKVGVAGCPACCSWANMMDIGFSGRKNGFVVILGGHGGSRPKIGQEAGRISSHEEAGEIIKRLAAMFSEHVKIKSRVDRMIEKTGLEEVKKRIGLSPISSG